jgi:ribosomal protein L11 methyltransferase
VAAPVEDDRDWWEVELRCDPGDQLETLGRLLPAGFAFYVREPEWDERLVRAYVPRERACADHFGAAFFSLVLDARRRGVAVPTVAWRPVRSFAIPEAVKQRWPLLEVGAQLLVVPAWAPLPASAARRVVCIDPCSGFGDGTHATTALCLEALETLLAGRGAAPSATVADVGCGTGILAVAAIALGAARAYAVDTDPAAVRGARRNRDLNAIPVDRLSVEHGSLDLLAATLPGPVDVFVCNLYADALVEMVPHLRRISHPRTRGVLSGLRPTEVPVLERALADAGWRPASVTARESWCCLLVDRQPI